MASLDQPWVENAERALIQGLVKSEAFRRLQEISFLGAIDYYNIHKSKENTWYFSRSDHTFGVLFLVKRLIDNIEISKKDRLYAVAACLCHDLGHSPFSHSTERAFKKINPDINHKVVLEFIMSAPEMGVSAVLSEFGLSVDRVLGISVGTDNELSWIFHNPINVDTLDGMLRFIASFRLQLPFDVLRAVDSLASLRNGDDLTPHDVDNLDVFWNVKASFYEHFLKRGAYAKFEDAYIELVLAKKKSVDYRDYLKIDRELAEEIGLEPELYFKHIEHEREYVPSKFYIDRSISLRSISDLYLRYVRKGGKA
ncbi:HD domain-containing protein [Mesorhizobium sp. B2-8-9]|uniref:HD domain-containing protein n=1 Tax=Mesorhizobium sp. B2-8-9 TaxID=2589899 RepID=UPI00112C5D5F|nr:HD domain-containing protein [Mesorhizobium sp. B2-8-9]TPI86491.1 HD domain-containing protein [Mesorhizobium sp. B2-8-9]